VSIYFFLDARLKEQSSKKLPPPSMNFTQIKPKFFYLFLVNYKGPVQVSHIVPTRFIVT